MINIMSRNKDVTYERYAGPHIEMSYKNNIDELMLCYPEKYKYEANNMQNTTLRHFLRNIYMG